MIHREGRVADFSRASLCRDEFRMLTNRFTLYAKQHRARDNASRLKGRAVRLERRVLGRKESWEVRFVTGVTALVAVTTAHRVSTRFACKSEPSGDAGP